MTAKTIKDMWTKNLKKPEGRFGVLVGEHLATENYEINMWAVHALNIQEGDSILEIGFGPGIAIEEIHKTTSAKYIAGFDYSELMVASAKKRNKQGVKRGKIDLKHASVTKVPDFGTKFDKVLAINNVMYWPDLTDSLINVRKIINGGGLIALVIQRNDEQFRAGGCIEEINSYQRCLWQAGFKGVNSFAQPVALQRSEKPLAGIIVFGFAPLIYESNSDDHYKKICDKIYADTLKPVPIAQSVKFGLKDLITSKK